MRSPLPDPICGRPFTIGEATALGITSYRLRGADLTVPVPGVRCAADRIEIHDLCAAIEMSSPVRVAFSHTTAALLHGLPVSTAMLEDDKIHACREGADRMLRHGTVRGHRGLESRAVVQVDGVSVVDLADTWVDMGELVGLGKPVGLDDLIIMGDAIATRLGSAEPLRAALDRRVRPRGKLTLLEALESIRVGSESPGETRTRLVLVRAGLPEPELNQPIIAENGRSLGRPDLRYPSVRLAIEYQGAEFHSTEEAKAVDELRFRRFGSAGWIVVQVWADDLNSDEARRAFVLAVAAHLGFPAERLTLGDCHPRFFSRRMLELAEIRARRERARHAAQRANR